MSDEVLEQLSIKARLVELKAGRTLFRQGQKDDSLYLVTEGSLSIIRKSDRGDQVLGEIGPGQLLGEMALLMEGPRSARAVATAQASLIQVQKKDIFRVESDTPYIHLKLWEAHNLHCLDNALADNDHLAFGSESEKQGWIDEYVLSELSRGDEERVPVDSGWMFVAFGTIKLREEPLLAGSLCQVNEGCQILAMTTPCKVLWLPNKSLKSAS